MLVKRCLVKLKRLVDIGGCWRSIVNWRSCILSWSGSDLTFGRWKSDMVPDEREREECGNLKMEQRYVVLFVWGR
jgi:hypothetical protein